MCVLKLSRVYPEQKNWTFSIWPLPSLDCHESVRKAIKKVCQSMSYNIITLLVSRVIRTLKFRFFLSLHGCYELGTKLTFLLIFSMSISDILYIKKRTILTDSPSRSPSFLMFLVRDKILHNLINHNTFF